MKRLTHFHYLRNPFYKGTHVVCKTHQKGIRSNTYNIIPREQREIIEDCHEAIIPKAEWEKVQQLIDRRPPIMKGNNCPYYNTQNRSKGFIQPYAFGHTGSCGYGVKRQRSVLWQVKPENGKTVPCRYGQSEKGI